MMQVKIGERYVCPVCQGAFIVIRAVNGEDDLACGGHALTKFVPGAVATPGDHEISSGGTALGKRYVNSDGSLEILVTKAGSGALTVGSAPLEARSAKPLPSSD